MTTRPRIRLARSGSRISAAEAQLINAKYPGTKGRVHGARKVKIPETNAGIASTSKFMVATDALPTF